MIGWYRSMRTRWTERQVYRRVMEAIDDPSQASAAGRWLAKDPERIAIYRRVASEVGRAGDAAAQMPDLGIATAPKPDASRGRVALLFGGTALVAAVAIGLGMGLERSDSHRMASRPHPLSSGSGYRLITLQDGSRVRLERTARIVPEFQPSRRSVRLIEGAATFSVAHDATRPFTVYVGGGSITAVGTEFEVRLEQKVMVHLISGIVSVTRPGDPVGSRNQSVRMTAGQRLAFDPTPAAAPDASLSPPADGVLFDDAKVSSVVEAVNRHSATKIVLDHPSIGELKVFARIDVSNATLVADKLAGIFGLVVTHAIKGEIHLAHKN